MKFWADENIETAILRALQDRCPDDEIVRIQDTDFSGADDVTLLAEAARQNIIMITHDKKTPINFAYDRVRNQLPMPGVIAVTQPVSTGVAIRHLIFLIRTSAPSDFDKLVWYIPPAV